MSDQPLLQPIEPQPSVELLKSISAADLNDLCDATDSAIEGGGGFGWIDLPSREILERYWQGVVVMPARLLFVARMDGVICGTCQLVLTPSNNQAQSHSAHLTSHFVSPWARGHGLSKMLISAVEKAAKDENIDVINLDVRETMEKAISLYEKAGFTRIGTHPHYAKVDGDYITGFYYTKLLS